MPFSTIIKSFNMIYALCCYVLTALRLGYNVLWFAFVVLSAVVPWTLATMVVCALAAKWVRLKRPAEGSVLLSELRLPKADEVDGGVDSAVVGGRKGQLFWPVASRGADFDAPENSAMALKMCSSKNCRNVMLDLAVTKCGELVILHTSTLQKQGESTGTANVNEITYESMQKFNVSEHHPLHGQFPPEKILTLANLLTLLETIDVVVFLFVSPATKSTVVALAKVIAANPAFTNRIVVCSSSVAFLYQIRKACSELVCGLWLDKNSALTTKCLPMSSLVLSLYRTLLRFFAVPLIGISVAFISKDEYNACTKQLWRNASVRPIVYSVNSPNEKQYFQKVLTTQYVTNSLRSEPQLLMPAIRK